MNSIHKAGGKGRMGKRRKGGNGWIGEQGGESVNFKKGWGSTIAVLLTGLLLFQVMGCRSPEKQSSSEAMQEDVMFQWPTEKWSTSTPERQGMDAGKLADADRRIQENYPNIYSLLVVKNGFLVCEHYYQGTRLSDANPVYSVTKSIMSALTGLAIEQKLLPGVDAKLAELLPETFAGADDAGKKEITVKHALTMSAGLASIDDNYTAFSGSRDWLQYALAKPLANKPGKVFTYNTGLTHFLSAAVAKASGGSTLAYAKQQLFDRIGISPGNWSRDPMGIEGGGSGLRLTPVDMAKFGYLYLNEGKWDGEQIIPREWVAESITRQISVNPEVDYGYLFWLTTMKDAAKGQAYATYRADGAGGQKIVVVPELDLVAVITANLGDSSRDGSDTEAIIADFVVPAVK